MQVIYAFQATLIPRGGQSRGDYQACLRDLAAAARSWAADHKLESPDGGGAPAVAEQVFDAERGLFTLAGAYPLDPEEAWRYLCEVGVARTPLGIQAHVILRVRLAVDGGPPSRFEPFRPGVVDRFLRLADGLAVGGEPIPTVPERFDVHGVPRLVDGLLLNPARQLPLVVMTPTESGRPLVEPRVMLEELLGLAHVAELANRYATFALTDRVGKLWSCFNGAVRVYWPKVTLDDSYKQHPIWFPDHYPPGAETDERLPLEVLRKLVGAASRRTLEAPFVTQLHGAAERQAKSATEARLAELAAGVAEGKEFMAELEKAWSENRLLTEEVEELRRAKAAMDEQWATVSGDIARANADADAQRKAADRYRERHLASLKRVREAVALAQEEFAETLHFLPTALDSAKDSPFLDAAKVFALFKALDGVARGMKPRGGLGEDLHAVLKRAGFEYKPHISMTSEGKFGDEYRFLHNGERKLFDNHVTLGSSHNPQECLSVHWLRDEGRGQFVVAWCGKHRTNTRT